MGDARGKRHGRARHRERQPAADVLHAVRQLREQHALGGRAILHAVGERHAVPRQMPRRDRAVLPSRSPVVRELHPFAGGGNGNLDDPVHDPVTARAVGRAFAQEPRAVQEAVALALFGREHAVRHAHGADFRARAERTGTREIAAERGNVHRGFDRAVAGRVDGVRSVEVERGGIAVARYRHAVPSAPRRGRALAVRHLARMVVAVRAVLEALDDWILAVHRADFHHQLPFGIVAEHSPLLVSGRIDRRFRVHDHHLERERLPFQRREREGRGRLHVAARVADPGIGRERGPVRAVERMFAGEVRPCGRRGDMHTRAAVLNRVEMPDQAVLHVERRGRTGGSARHDARRHGGRERRRAARDGRAVGQGVEDHVGRPVGGDPRGKRHARADVGPDVQRVVLPGRSAVRRELHAQSAHVREHLERAVLHAPARRAVRRARAHEADAVEEVVAQDLGGRQHTLSHAHGADFRAALQGRHAADARAERKGRQRRGKVVARDRVEDVHAVAVERGGRSVAHDGQMLALAPRGQSGRIRNGDSVRIGFRAVLETAHERVLAVDVANLHRQVAVVAALVAEVGPIFKCVGLGFGRVGNHHLQRERLVLQGGERLRGRGGDVAVGVAHPGVGGERRTVDERERLVAGEVRPFGRRGDVHARPAVLDRVEMADQPVLHVERRGQCIAPRHAVRDENRCETGNLLHVFVSSNGLATTSATASCRQLDQSCTHRRSS